jgi:tripartite-type tricarboxylate transporter receptor subunit TctC
MGVSNLRRVLRPFVLVIALLIGAPAAWAQASYPNKAIKLLVGFAPGGFTDLAGRVIAQALSESLGVPVVVENRTGVNGLIASDLVARASPDGYTLLLSSIGLTTNPVLSSNMRQDPVSGFTPISLLAIIPNILVVHPSIPVNNLEELLAFARKSPHPLTQASAGYASPGHLSGVLLEQMTGVAFQQIPYKGTGAALSDLIGGSSNLSFPVISTAVPFIKNGKLRAIAVTSAKRSPLLPEVPTISEAGAPGFDVGGWYAIVGPPGMSTDLSARLTQELKKVLEIPSVRKRFIDEGAEPIGSSAVELSEFLARDYKKWQDVFRDGKIKIEAP